MSQAKGGTGTGMMRGVLETRLLHIHLGRRGVTGASYITTGSIAYIFPIIQSVIIIVYIYIYVYRI